MLGSRRDTSLSLHRSYSPPKSSGPLLKEPIPLQSSGSVPSQGSSSTPHSTKVPPQPISLQVMKVPPSVVEVIYEFNKIKANVCSPTQKTDNPRLVELKQSFRNWVEWPISKRHIPLLLGQGQT
ncbi:hypothetical protein ACFX1W_029881 [Malus domestica]